MALSISIMAKALSISSFVYFGADMPIPLVAGGVFIFDFDELRCMAALIFAIAVESAPIFFAISRAFSGDIPVAFIIRFILAEELSFLSDNLAVGAAIGIDDPITIILENKSFEPLMSSFMTLAFCKSVSAMPAILQISASVATRLSARRFETSVRAGCTYRPVNASPSDLFLPRCLSRLWRLYAIGSTVIANTVDFSLSLSYGIPMTYSAPVIFSLASSSAKFSIRAISDAE